DIGGIGEVAREGAHHIAERFAVRMTGTVERRGRADRGERRRRRDARRPQRDLLDARRRLYDRSLDRESPRQQRRDLLLLLRGRAFALVSPPPELPPPIDHCNYLRAVPSCSDRPPCRSAGPHGRLIAVARHDSAASAYPNRCIVRFLTSLRALVAVE